MSFNIKYVLAGNRPEARQLLTALGRDEVRRATAELPPSASITSLTEFMAKGVYQKNWAGNQII
jgi:hypothetical protein